MAPILSFYYHYYYYYYYYYFHFYYYYFYHYYYHFVYRVKSIKAAQVNVSLRNTKLHGRIYISEIWDDIKEVNMLRRLFIS